MTTYASTYVLVALSIDRYDAITHPMNFSGSWKRAKLLIISAWLLSALFSSPQFFLYEETLIQGKTDCGWDFEVLESLGEIFLVLWKKNSSYLFKKFKSKRLG